MNSDETMRENYYLLHENFMQEQVLLAEPISAIIIKCCYDVPQYVHIPLSPSSPTNVQELGGYSPSHLFHMPEFPVFPGKESRGFTKSFQEQIQAGHRA
jgi:hypothetical protein